GRGSHGVWEWLEQRGLIEGLAPGLAAIGRHDLLELIATLTSGPSVASSPSDVAQAKGDRSTQPQRRTRDEPNRPPPSGFNDLLQEEQQARQHLLEVTRHCEWLTKDEITRVASKKYLPNIYVARALENVIWEYLQSDDKLSTRLS